MQRIYIIMRKKLFPVLLFILILILFPYNSSANWQNFGGDLQHSGYSENKPVPLELNWKYKIGNSEITAPIIDSGILFVGSDDNNIYAINIISGELKWKYSALGKFYTPAAINKMVFAASFDNNIYALDYDGNLLWTYSTGSNIASPPVVYNDLLYGGSEKNVYSIHIKNGSLKWRYATNDWIESTPAIVQGVLFVGSNDNSIYALNADDKELRWSYRTGGRVSSSPSIINGILFVGSNDGKVYAMDSSSGDLKWSRNTNDWVRSSPAISGRSLYIGSNDNFIYSLHTDNGDVLWKFQTAGQVESPPIVIRDMVYAGSNDGNIYVLDTKDGSLKDQYSLESGVIALAVSDNMLFATSTDGYVYAFGASVSQPSVIEIPLPDTIPPVLVIKPVPIEVTSKTLSISGTARDSSGILVVIVNGIEAGTTSWNATVTLIEGMNTIKIVAVDNNGNIQNKMLNVSYVPGAVSAGDEKETSKIPGFNILFSLFGFIISMHLIRFKKI